MGIFNRFPFSDEHQLNLDWILRSLKSLDARVKDLEDSGGGGGGGGTTDYLDLDNKPQINSVTLTGNKTAAQLGLKAAADTEDYLDLDNKPQINSVTLTGNKTAADLGLAKSNEVLSLSVAMEEGIIPIPITYTGKYVNTGTDPIPIPFSPTSSVNFDSIVIECSEGDIFTINAVPNSTNTMAWTFVDSSGNILTHSTQNNISHPKYNEIISAPANAAYLIINNRKATDPNAVSYYGKSKYVKPPSGIPASDLAAGIIPTEVTVSTAGAVTQALDAGTIYHFTGALTSLTLTLNAAASWQVPQYHFDFESGSTAPTVTLPGTVTMQGGTFTPEANKRYEVDILNGYGVSMAW